MYSVIGILDRFYMLELEQLGCLTGIVNISSLSLCCIMDFRYNQSLSFELTESASWVDH